MHTRNSPAVQREEKARDYAGNRMLLRLIEKLFPEEEILTHYQPKWLKGEDLAIYLPYSRIAFEYHGLDHFRKGRNEGRGQMMEEIHKQDLLKILECHRHGVLLIAIPNTEPMTLSQIKNRLQREGSVAPSLWSSLLP